MAQIKKDDNQVPTLTGVLNTDGVTPTRVKINASTHILQVQDASTGSDFGSDRAVRDDNGEPISIAVSSSDGSTPVPLYVNSSGQLLIDSN